MSQPTWPQPPAASTREPSNDELAAARHGQPVAPYRPAPAPPSADERPMRPMSGPRKAMVAGCLVGGLAIAGGGGVLIAQAVTAPDRDVVTLQSGVATVHLPADATRSVYVRNGVLAPEACQVQGTGNLLVTVRPGNFSSQTGSQTTTEVVNFQVPREGDYTVRCTVPQSTPAPEVFVAQKVDSGFVRGLGAILVGTMIAIGGTILTLTVGRRSRTD